MPSPACDVDDISNVSVTACADRQFEHLRTSARTAAQPVRAAQCTSALPLRLSRLEHPPPRRDEREREDDPGGLSDAHACYGEPVERGRGREREGKEGEEEEGGGAEEEREGEGESLRMLRSGCECR